MRHRHARIARTLLACAAVGTLAGCGRTYDIGNLDSAALAAAIEDANANPGADVIRLAPKGLYTLRDAARADVFLPPITDDLRIEGRGAEIRRYADGQRGLLHVGRGADVTLRDLALSEGSDGAIRNYGTLRLDQVKVTDSTGTGAIVLNHGLLEARDSEIAWNLLPGGHRDAGTIVNYGQLRLRDTAIHDNTAQRRYPELAVAGAVLNLGTLETHAARISDNSAQGDGEYDVRQLAFPAVLNLGNGKVEGDLPRDLVREAGMIAVAVH